MVELEQGISIGMPAVDPSQVAVFADEVFRHALTKPPNFVLVSADSCGSLRWNAFRERFPERVIEVGIVEGCAMAVAFGLARTGLKVFVAGYSTFLLFRGIEVMRSYVAHQRADVTILGGMSGLSASHDGFMHQSVEDIGLLQNIEGMSVIVPSDATSTRLAAQLCLTEPGPRYVRLVRREVSLPRSEPLARGLGFRHRGGNDVVICSYGPLLETSLEAALALGQRGVGTSVLEVGLLAPLPAAELAAAVQAFNRIIVVEDHLPTTGLGALLTAAVDRDAHRIRRLGISPSRAASGAYGEVLAAAGLDAGAIVRAALTE
jgi:transketolase